MKQQKYQQEGIIVLRDEELEGIVGGAGERWNTWHRNKDNTVTLRQHYKHDGVVDHGRERKLNLTTEGAYIPKGARDIAVGKSYREDL
jgi:hypothetical protein